MISWLANLFINMGEQMLTEQQRAERGGITINATEVHIHGQADSLDKPEDKGRGFTRFSRR
ncbi:hypothetical protein GS885_02405 [Rhodococcus hoagii]|nr:hypothetical protein [Prescottella equi]NKT40020.1 hypothetical protein [Prescottella equi]NKT56884.1 hypothetical protein [Prescottella equi]NKT61663.1 hypothetical protein [Prescottella equi]NKT81990.1 hypothetical protein [Prescottella equi]